MRKRKAADQINGLDIQWGMKRPKFNTEATEIKVMRGQDRRHVLGWDSFIKTNFGEGISKLSKESKNDEQAKNKLMKLAESQGCTFNKTNNQTLESVEKRVAGWLNSTPCNLNPEDAVENQAIETVRGQLLRAKDKLNEIAMKEGASENKAIFQKAQDEIKTILKNNDDNTDRVKHANEIREIYRNMINNVKEGDWQELTRLTGDMANTMGTDLSKKEGASDQTKFALELDQQLKAMSVGGVSGEEFLKKLFELREMPKEPNS
jgi:hypothetical protein